MGCVSVANVSCRAARLRKRNRRRRRSTVCSRFGRCCRGGPVWLSACPLCACIAKARTHTRLNSCGCFVSHCSRTHARALARTVNAQAHTHAHTHVRARIHSTHARTHASRRMPLGVCGLVNRFVLSAAAVNRKAVNSPLLLIAGGHSRLFLVPRLQRHIPFITRALSAALVTSVLLTLTSVMAYLLRSRPLVH